VVSASLGGLEVLAFECVFRWEIGPFSTLVSLACPTSPNPFLWTSPKKIGTDSFLAMLSVPNNCLFKRQHCEKAVGPNFLFSFFVDSFCCRQLLLSTASVVDSFCCRQLLLSTASVVDSFVFVLSFFDPSDWLLLRKTGGCLI
jgi:DNA-directed RNA polymerase subunit N (RpoN/RPB10)